MLERIKDINILCKFHYVHIEVFFYHKDHKSLKDGSIDFFMSITYLPES